MQNPSFNHSSSDAPPPHSAAMRPSHHRRAHSEMNFRLPKDFDLVPDAFDPSSGNIEEIGSEDDLFSTYMDIEKLSAGAGCGSGNGDSAANNDGGESGCAAEKDDEKSGGGSRPRHRHSSSVDSSGFVFGESSIEAKKAMAPEKLAELWTVDPKRAKRILANRQSAARSKERKARYIFDLERKVQTLQTEATTLSAQLALFQRDTTGLNNENTELKLRLQAMEQQAQLRDAFSEALKQEVERLQVATGVLPTSLDSLNKSMQQHISYEQSAFFPHPSDSQNLQVEQFHPVPPHVHFQGLDICNSTSHNVKSEGMSIPATEGSTTF